MCVCVYVCVLVQSFLSLCQGNHYQFDTLRRAKHSSMMVLYHLHNPAEPAFSSTCNMCQREMEAGTGYRCTKCQDFDLCADCKQTRGHEHPLVVSVMTHTQHTHKMQICSLARASIRYRCFVSCDDTWLTTVMG